MHEIAYLKDIVILFGAALLVLAVSSRLRIPPIVGFLLTGMMVGPHALAWIDDPEHVEQFAEFGVVFLLFLIGLELSTERLQRLWRIMTVGGSVQVFGTIAAAGAIAFALGASSAQAFFIGSVVALSSTAVVMKLYDDRRELDAPHGQVSLGILLFQDFLIVPLLLVVPLLAGSGGSSVGDVLVRFGVGLVVVGVVFLGGRYILPFFLHAIARTRIRELFVIGALFACLASAWATDALGFSMALGAFLAGILIGESEYNIQVAAEVTPFRDVFNSMFFISVGMLLRLDFVAEHALLVAGVGLCIVVLKATVALLAALVLRFPPRTCILTALGLAQIGEFSFVLARAGHANALVDDQLYQLTIASAVLTVILTPVLVAIAPRLADGLQRVFPAARLGPIDEEGSGLRLKGHVIIAGFGLGGRNLARVLDSAQIPYVVVELNGHTVRQARRLGEPIVFGDVTRPGILEEIGIHSAQAAVFVVSDARAVRRGVRMARRLNSELFIIARSRELSEIEELQRDGANEVIAQEFESSIEIVTRVLERLHVPRNVITTQEKVLRADGYQALRAPSPPRGISDKLMQALAAGTTDTFLISDDHHAVGKTIQELHLRRHTGVTIIAVVRSDRPFTSPPADFALRAGDVLVLVGDHAQIERAFQFLEHTEEDAADPT